MRRQTECRLLLQNIVLRYLLNLGHPIACEGDGLYDGKNNPFSQEFYEMCGQVYYDAFIEGCMSVENNTREVCESATDAE